MLLRDLSKVWISKNEPTNSYGEYTPSWSYVGVGYFNIQQDVSELDRKSSGEIDYDILRARATQDYGIETGFGISFTDISESLTITPDYRVVDVSKIGSTYLVRMEKYNGD